ncbi:MAG: hypothetical protein AM326_03410 [Candidatus Thorarchaeota archaeon SMTZ-45]|jgi:hypothetical protein|nr:MAG: hypothetical protein AM326_03410 [Candidatus Thorarchaeota archaeon SMTZ-45]
MSEELVGSLSHTPVYAYHRYLSGSSDTLPETVKRHGLNTEGFKFAHVQVVPSDGANPNVKVLFWSDKAAKFVEKHSSLSFAGKGVDVAFEFDVECNGRTMFVSIPSGVTAGQKCRVYAAGFHILKK